MNRFFSLLFSRKGELGQLKFLCIAILKMALLSGFFWIHDMGPGTAPNDPFFFILFMAAYFIFSMSVAAYPFVTYAIVAKRLEHAGYNRKWALIAGAAGIFAPVLAFSGGYIEIGPSLCLVLEFLCALLPGKKKAGA